MFNLSEIAINSKSAVTMNHLQQLEPSLGKRTELICTPNKYFKNNILTKTKLYLIGLLKFKQ